MGNFARTLRLALNYYWTVAASVVCALVVAVLWGGNIGFLYPLVEVVGKNQSLGQWVDAEIVAAHQEIAAGEVAGDEQATRAARHDLWLYGELKPWIDQYLPTDPFQTLAVVVALLLAGTIIKDAFLTTGSFLVDRLAQLATFDLRKQFYRRTLRMDLVTFSENGTSDLLSRFTHDVEQIAGGIQTLFGRAVREPLKMIVCLAGAAYICWQLLLLSLVVAPLAGFLIGLLAKTLKRANRKALEEMSSL